ncbi:hypothetical protein ANANG_G00070580 [Anguilla anguilla]|uniref:Uncharacterized protein n=1 Tax=Anguilla anguilla TaxID=7936 RepID=A0A9D3MQE0_ANGAN|nr:hypothetical protein ANANG_G00070580 [Anguilla anguilla]
MRPGLLFEGYPECSKLGTRGRRDGVCGGDIVGQRTPRGARRIERPVDGRCRASSHRPAPGKSRTDGLRRANQTKGSGTSRSPVIMQQKIFSEKVPSLRRLLEGP